MTTAAAPPRRRQPSYPPKVVEFARRMYEGGKKPPEIKVALERHGYSPGLTTIRYWVDDELRANHMRKKRDGLYPSWRLNARERRIPVWEARRRRLVELREVGLSFSSIAKVANHDFGLELTTEQVRGMINRTLHSQSIRAGLEGRRIRRGHKGGADE